MGGFTKHDARRALIIDTGPKPVVRKHPGDYILAEIAETGELVRMVAPTHTGEDGQPRAATTDDRAAFYALCHAAGYGIIPGAHRKQDGLLEPCFWQLPIVETPRIATEPDLEPRPLTADVPKGAALN